MLKLIKSEKIINRIRNSKIEIDLDKCTKCQACISICPVRLYFFESNSLQIHESFEKNCIECGHCVAICPVNVINLQYHKEQSLKDISIRENIPSYDSYLTLSLTRRSIRQFKEDSVSKDLIEKLLEVGRYSPTAVNSENVYYTIVQNKAVVKKISKTITEKVARFVKKYEDPQERENLKERISEEEFKSTEENLSNIKRTLKIAEHGGDP